MIARDGKEQKKTTRQVDYPDPADKAQTKIIRNNRRKMTTTTTKSLLLFCFAFLGHFIGLISAIVETPWNYGTLDIEKAKASGRRRLVALNDNSAPSVLSAILSSDGSFLIVTLSQPTNNHVRTTLPLLQLNEQPANGRMPRQLKYPPI